MRLRLSSGALTASTGMNKQFRVQSGELRVNVAALSALFDIPPQAAPKLSTLNFVMICKAKIYKEIRRNNEIGI